MKQKKWSELSPAGRVAIIAASVTELVVTAVASRDLSRRPTPEVRGPKLLWWPVLFVQPIGSPLYLLFGRRRSPSADAP